MELCRLDFLFNAHSGSHLQQVIESGQSSPVLLGTLPKFENYMQHAVMSQAALPFLGRMTCRRKRRFNRRTPMQCTSHNRR